MAVLGPPGGLAIVVLAFLWSPVAGALLVLAGVLIAARVAFYGLRQAWSTQPPPQPGAVRRTSEGHFIDMLFSTN